MAPDQGSGRAGAAGPKGLFLRAEIYQMNQLVRFALRIFNRCSDQESLVERVSQDHCRSDGTAKMGHSNGNGRDLIVRRGQYEPGSQHDINDSIIIPKCGTRLEKDNWCGRQVQNWREGLFRGLSGGVLCHDGSYNLFKWDRTKGCMAPFELSNPGNPTQRPEGLF